MRRRNLTRAGAIFVAIFFFFLSMAFMAGCREDPPPPPPPECVEDADCPGGKACEGGNCVMKVVAPPPECTSDDDCSDNKICKNQKCKYICVYDSDCGSDQECKDHRCVEADCEVATIRFDFNEYYLTSSAESTLRANAKCIKKKNASLNKVIVEGHCDERGSIQYNLSLGQKRAQSVKNFLVDLGVDSSKVKVLSYGEERPIDSDSTEEAWSKNRRSETVLQ